MNILRELEFMELLGKPRTPKRVNGSVNQQKRNLECMFYRKCLDFVAENFWNGFSCEDCDLIDIKILANLPLPNLNPEETVQLPGTWKVN